MIVSAAGFAEPIKVLFGPLYGVRIGPTPSCRVGAQVRRRAVTRRPRRTALGPLAAAPARTRRAGRRRTMQILQGGDFRVYCLYIIAALVVLLAVAIG